MSDILTLSQAQSLLQDCEQKINAAINQMRAIEIQLQQLLGARDMAQLIVSMLSENGDSASDTAPDATTVQSTKGL